MAFFLCAYITIFNMKFFINLFSKSLFDTFLSAVQDLVAARTVDNVVEGPRAQSGELRPRGHSTPWRREAGRPRLLRAALLELGTLHGCVLGKGTGSFAPGSF